MHIAFEESNLLRTIYLQRLPTFLISGQSFPQHVHLSQFFAHASNRTVFLLQHSVQKPGAGSTHTCLSAFLNLNIFIVSSRGSQHFQVKNPFLPVPWKQQALFESHVFLCSAFEINYISLISLFPFQTLVDVGEENKGRKPRGREDTFVRTWKFRPTLSVPYL